jgi:NAD(P)-dependent dehydrogenase (short-subunit alcohol dehydrogenase family)
MSAHKSSIRNTFGISLAALLMALSGLLNSVIAGEISADKPTVLITGANRGIGLAFVEHYVGEGWNVIATARSPDRAEVLMAIEQDYPNLLIEQLDVTDHGRITELADNYNGTAIDILINNAGVLGDLQKQTMGNLDTDVFTQVMAVNVLAPMKMIEAFSDHVAQSDQKKIVTITSGAGVQSGDMSRGGLYFYRISKTSVNMLMRVAQGELAARGIIVIPIAPGMVMTDMLREAFGERPPGAGFPQALTPAESVAGMTSVIATLDSNYNGHPMNHDGSELPW